MAKLAASESKSKDIKIKPAASMAELDRERVAGLIGETEARARLQSGAQG